MARMGRIRAKIRASEPASFLELAEPLVQFCQRILENFAVPRILAGCDLLNHSLSRQPQILPLTAAGGLFRAQPDTGLGGLLGSFVLLRFD